MRFIDIVPAELDNPLQRVIAAMKLKALMLWPEDEFKRFDFIASAVKKMAETTATRLKASVTFDKEFYQIEGAAGRSDPQRMIEDATNYVVYGSLKAPNAPKQTAPFIAGCILLDAIGLQHQGDTDISLVRLLEMRSKSLTGSKNSRPQDLKSHWHAYKNVAHLCAAEILLDFPEPASNLEQILARAEKFRRDGITIKHLHAQKPLLDAETSWQLSSEMIRYITRT